MPNILIVDDSTVDRRVAGAILKKSGDFALDYAINGREALDKMRSAAFDLVLTDLLMPGMNGLELVSAARAQYPRVPVVLMTSRGSEEIAARALSMGAASYIPKRLLPRRLAEIVRRVLAVSRRWHEDSRLLGCLTENRSTFVLGNDLALVESLVVYLQENCMQMGLCDATECTRIGVALQEALVNAVHHGNFQIGSEFREDKYDQYAALVARRGQESPYRDRRIHVSARLTRDEAIFVVRDEGVGFDPSSLPDPCDPENLEKVSGRGVFLMRALMDEVRFEDRGRAVTLVKRRRMRVEE
jgi:CheY-like chemotaxis protein